MLSVLVRLLRVLPGPFGVGIVAYDRSAFSGPDAAPYA